MEARAGAAREHDAEGGDVDLARIGLCIGDEFSKGFDRDQGIHLQDESASGKCGYWNEVSLSPACSLAEIKEISNAAAAAMYVVGGRR